MCVLTEGSFLALVVARCGCQLRLSSVDGEFIALCVLMLYDWETWRCLLPIQAGVCEKRGRGWGVGQRDQCTQIFMGSWGVEVCLERRGVGQDFGYQSDLCLEVAIQSKN